MVCDCVEYKGHIGKAGYGLDYNPETQKTVLAHRYAYYLAYGKIPEGLVISHDCNNKKCVNPKHLKATTQAANVQKAYKDGLQINALRSLNKETVLAIMSSTSPQRGIATLYGTSQKTVCNIKRGKTYCDITGKGGSCGV